MPIFRIEGQTLHKLAVAQLDKERSLQHLVEANLTEVLGMHFLATEYVTTTGGRIDTLAVDEAGCPVIIEYKKRRDINVINQSLSYLKWLRTQKREFFEKLLVDKLGAEVANSFKLDWGNVRVVCIAESYSRFDIDTAEVVALALRIELLRYRFYADQVFSLEPVTVAAAEEHLEPIITDASPRAVKSNAEEKPQISVEVLLSPALPETRALFNKFREWITTLDEAIVEKPNTVYLAYRLTRNFAEVYIKKNALQIYLRAIEYDDPSGMMEKIPNGYNWTLSKRLYIRTSDDLANAQPLIEQSYRDVL